MNKIPNFAKMAALLEMPATLLRWEVTDKLVLDGLSLTELRTLYWQMSAAPKSKRKLLRKLLEAHILATNHGTFEEWMDTERLTYWTPEQYAIIVEKIAAAPVTLEKVARAVSSGLHSGLREVLERKKLESLEARLKDCHSPTSLQVLSTIVNFSSETTRDMLKRKAESLVGDCLRGGALAELKALSYVLSNTGTARPDVVEAMLQKAESLDQLQAVLQVCSKDERCRVLEKIFAITPWQELLDWCKQAQLAMYDRRSYERVMEELVARVYNLEQLQLLANIVTHEVGRQLLVEKNDEAAARTLGESASVETLWRFLQLKLSDGTRESMRQRIIAQAWTDGELAIAFLHAQTKAERAHVLKKLVALPEYQVAV